MQSQVDSRIRRIVAIIAAFVTAPWVFVGILWASVLIASRVGKPLKEIPYFWVIAAFTVAAAFALAVWTGVWVMRVVSGRRRPKSVALPTA